MARAWQCDACGKFVQNAYRDVRITVVAASKSFDIDVAFPMDLCKECCIESLGNLRNAENSKCVWKPLTEDEDNQND